MVGAAVEQIEADVEQTPLERVVLTRETVEQWPVQILKSGHRVIAPVLLAGQDGQSEYRELTDATGRVSGFGKGFRG